MPAELDTSLEFAAWREGGGDAAGQGEENGAGAVTTANMEAAFVEAGLCVAHVERILCCGIMSMGTMMGREGMGRKKGDNSDHITSMKAAFSLQLAGRRL